MYQGVHLISLITYIHTYISKLIRQVNTEKDIKKEKVKLLLNDVCCFIIRGNPLYKHVLLCVHNKVTPMTSRNQHLALDLPKVRMCFPEFSPAAHNIWAVYIAHSAMFILH